MKRKGHPNNDIADLDTLIEGIIVDAYGEDEHLRAFRQAFEDDVAIPADGFVIGEPVSVATMDYDGNERRGLTATCRREDGAEHVIAACDVVFSEGSNGARYVAAYRKWLGLDPYPAGAKAPSLRMRQHKATADDLDLSGPIELVALSVKDRAVRCRLLGNDRAITLRPDRTWDVFPGEILTIIPRKQWSFSGHPYLSGEIASSRLDAAAIGLVPLHLEDHGMWDPIHDHWGQEGEPISAWAKAIIARGPRPMFGMVQVLPGADDDPFSDPISRSNDLEEVGDREGAYKILMEAVAYDLRCLDAHTHLGNFVFDHTPKEAVRHYEAGIRIGELSLGDGFDGVLLWDLIGNRPFLRCMHAYGRCLWRLERFDEAVRVFDRMLWLNPSDNQGVRFLIEDVRAGNAWEAGREEW